MTKEITAKDAINFDFQLLFPPIEDESNLLLSCRRSDYSASQISRAVEDCDAQVLNLNVTSLSKDVSDVVVSLRVNHRNPAPITRSLERYGYEVLTASSKSTNDADTMRSRANELLRYLEL